MDRGTSSPEASAGGDQHPHPGIDTQPCPAPTETPGAALNIGSVFLKTVRHFFPDFNPWLDRLRDTRDQEAIIYPRRFLGWCGICLFSLQLRSRRQLDFNLDADGTQVLNNLNRLADTDMTTRPVHDTLDHFLGHSSPASFADLRTKMIRRLIRMKTLDSARLLGRFVVIVDGTGWLSFSYKHCDRCLIRRHATYTSYQHHVLEAKLLGPEDMVLSVGTAFIENEPVLATAADQPDGASPTLVPVADSAAGQPDSASPTQDPAETSKQDCELKALDRLVVDLKVDFPQTPFCLAGDALFACGRVLQIAKDNKWSYVLTFKEGHMPAVWRDFLSLLDLCPENRLKHEFIRDGKKVVQVYRWVHDLSYEDDQNRRWTFHGILCDETVEGQTTRFAWITDLHVTANQVVDIATRGGRKRWCTENQGFNRQKNGGYHLEHAYSTDPENAKAFYFLLQIAMILNFLVEKGPLLRRLAAAVGKSVLGLFGSLQNIARRLLESLRFGTWDEDEAPEQPLDPPLADTS